MKSLVVLSLALLALAGCSEQAQNETIDAADTVAADVNATMGEAVGDVEAATESALSTAENTIDDAGAAIGNAAERSGDALKNGGNEID